MNGYHIYYQTKDDDKYSQINYLAQLSSILNWKEHYGQIKLYCNKRFLDSISKYGLDKEYDFIDTEFLETIPFKESQNIFWSFAKLYVANEIVKTDTEFCILDTDIWIQEPGLIDTGSDLSFYHREAFDINYKLNPYPDPATWMDKKELSEYDWNIYPMNCAIIYFKNRSKELINTWYSLALKIVSDNQNNMSEENLRAGTIFIEQRLLPVIATKLGLSIGYISPNIYLTWVSYTKSDGREWRPQIGHNEHSLNIAVNIKHVWGAKNYYDIECVRNLIIGVAVLSLAPFQIVNKFNKLYTEVIELYTEKI